MKKTKTHPPNIQMIDDINLVDNFNPGEMVYDVDGIQIYKNKKATVMVKVLQPEPLKFVVLYTNSL
jgi:hypothetical protein